MGHAGTFLLSTYAKKYFIWGHGMKGTKLKHGFFKHQYTYPKETEPSQLFALFLNCIFQLDNGLHRQPSPLWDFTYLLMYLSSYEKWLWAGVQGLN